MINEPKPKYISWWMSMTFEDQYFKIIKYLSNNDRDTTELHPHTITDKDIEAIFNWEVNSKYEAEECDESNMDFIDDMNELVQKIDEDLLEIY
jgi:hypothetical protein